MRYFLFILMFIIMASPAFATDLRSTATDSKTALHVGINPGTPDGREGGEDLGTAIVITNLPFDDTGNTSDNINDYDYACPTGSSLSPDVVYSFTPSTDSIIRVDLCYSSYDTKTYILDGAFNLIACNDDFYFEDNCGTYVSLIEHAYLIGGTEYFIVIDGYGGDSGDYVLNIRISDPVPPWDLTCDGLEEGEPALSPYYYDVFNGGCNSPDYGNPFSDLTQAGDANGELEYCGVSGWYGQNPFIRDTDWMYFMIGGTGIIEWTLEAEYETIGYLLSGECDDDIAVVEQITFFYLSPANMSIQGDPGEIVMLWVGPPWQDSPNDYGFEYNYKCTFSGLYSAGSIQTTGITFDAMKSLYR